MMTFFQVVEVPHHWHYYCLCSVQAGKLGTEQTPVSKPQAESALLSIMINKLEIKIYKNIN